MKNTLQFCATNTTTGETLYFTDLSFFEKEGIKEIVNDVGVGTNATYTFAINSLTQEAFSAAHNKIKSLQEALDESDNYLLYKTKFEAYCRLRRRE